MLVKTVNLEYKDSDPIINIWAVTDLHDGTIHHPEDKVIGMMQTIAKTPHSRVIDLGDSAEFITPQDPRFELGSIASYVDKKNIAYSEAEHVASYYQYLKQEGVELDGKLEGNHEYSYSKHSDSNIQTILCKMLGCDDLGPSAFVRYLCKRKGSNESHLIVGFFAHGASSATTKPAKLNMLLRVMDDFEADFYGMGHVHDIITTTNTRLGLDSKARVKAKRTAGAICGCMFRTYTEGPEASYGEKRLYPPTIMGTVCFQLDCRTGIVTPREVLL